MWILKIFKVIEIPDLNNKKFQKLKFRIQIMENLQEIDVPNSEIEQFIE